LGQLRNTTWRKRGFSERQMSPQHRRVAHRAFTHLWLLSGATTRMLPSVMLLLTPQGGRGLLPAEMRAACRGHLHGREPGGMLGRRGGDRRNTRWREGPLCNAAQELTTGHLCAARYAAQTLHHPTCGDSAKNASCRNCGVLARHEHEGRCLRPQISYRAMFLRCSPYLQRARDLLSCGSWMDGATGVLSCGLQMSFRSSR
jgi:hypothetical protein